MVPGDAALVAAALDVGRHLIALQRRVVTAESCTAGWIAKALTDPPGSSQWFDRGYVTYSNASKAAELGVLRTTLEQHGAVSEATVLEMARGALARSGVDVAVAVSGIAGPDGGSGDKPVGTVWFAVQWKDSAAHDGYASPRTRRENFSGGRDDVRRHSVLAALRMLLEGAPVSSSAL
jgi:nicotinamide-nucleotide amidase